MGGKGSRYCTAGTEYLARPAWTTDWETDRRRGRRLGDWATGRWLIAAGQTDGQTEFGSARACLGGKRNNPRR